eukprot:TRINITY_DN4581_c0_g1_i1.p1 TRINITY_DN4581_c0_g1~~TRINITY_DN4581_c0_g1_i1.p1  ORF type:complete len:229 (+),score=35.12 TRINITY_DN4581_c0_g1_i1:76-762(+)
MQDLLAGLEEQEAAEKKSVGSATAATPPKPKAAPRSVQPVRTVAATRLRGCGVQEATAAAIEEALFGRFGGVNDRYRAQLRMLLANISNIVEEVNAGEWPPERLSRCAAPELSAAERRAARAAAQRHELLARVEETTEDLCPRCGLQQHWQEAKGAQLREEKTVWEPEFYDRYCTCTGTPTHVGSLSAEHEQDSPEPIDWICGLQLFLKPNEFHRKACYFALIYSPVL